MKSILAAAKKGLIIITVFVQAFGYSSLGLSQVAFAEDPPSCPTVTGTNSPTGSAAHTFTFNSALCIWENAYYSWDPQTKQYTPKYSQEAVYNPDTNSWDRTVWEYVPAAGEYQSRIISTPATTAEQAAAGDPPATTAQSTAGSGEGSGALAESSGSSTISNTGTGSDNTILNNNNAIINADLSNYASVLTTLNSNATSGDALALNNTTVGNVSTGDAEALAYVLNMIQSSWDPTNGDIAMFNANLNNNYYGDLLFDPSFILNTGTTSNNTISNNGSTELTVNVINDASIENNINLNATSGNATANGNTTTGDISSGDATAIANVLNMINSMITSGQSFIGAINLYGDLNGDILLPQSILAQLMNTGTNSTNSINNTNNTTVDADINTNSSITNNTNLTSLSGNADANGNTNVGNVSTGNADTSVNEMNLVGQNITGTKGLMVFVNVLGTWIGMLFNSPGNTTIAGTGTGSNNTVDNNANLDADVDINNNYEITNNLNLNATSGNATANGNTTVGNVSTGNASTAVNLLNMIDSTMEFSDWFGVLFINVFGHWDGSFGVNTAAGNSTTSGKGGGAASGGTASTVASASTSSAQNKVFAFVQRGGGGGGAGTTEEPSQSTSQGASSTNTTAADALLNQEGITTTMNTPKWPSWVLPVGGVTLAILLLGFERFLALRRPS